MYSSQKWHYLVGSLILFLFMTTAATASMAPANLPTFHERGGFAVYFVQGGQWQRGGFLAFDEFFREKELVLAPQTGIVHLRLVKEGKRVAHIDRVLLGGKAAVAVSGVSDSAPLSKLAGKDFDVIHLSEGEAAIELSFSEGRKLQLAARVEGERLDETPFRFPSANLRREMTPDSQFYRYAPSGTPTEIFSEATAPGTGHPWGRTSVLAQVRGERLELVLDFESDNTLDGNKDYASVHVRQGDGVRTYTVSRDQQEWGHPYFIYSPEVPWQHKVYRFSLPLAELQARADKPLELAFSAYGTAGPGPYSPVPAYGEENNQYLTVWYQWYDDDRSEMQSQVYSPEGAPMDGVLSITTRDSISKDETAVAYDPGNNRFLSLWRQKIGGISMIHRQLVSAANSIVGTIETLPSVTAQRFPSAAFSTTSSRYLAIWTEEVTGGWDLRGQLFKPDASEFGTTIPICTLTADPGVQGGRLAYSPSGDLFLAVWEDSRNQTTSGSDVYGRMIGADGTLKGIDISISSAPGSQVSPDIVFDPDHNRSLVVWQDSRNSATSGEDVYGVFLGNGLMQQGNELVISTAAGDQWAPQVGYAGNGNFLVVWEDRATSYHELHGRWIDSNGEMLSGEQTFVKLDSKKVSGSRLADDGKGNFLAVYNLTSVADGLEIGTKQIIAPSFSRIFLLALPALLNAGSN